MDGGLQVCLAHAAQPADTDAGGYGVTLDRSTVVHWVDRAAWWLQGLYDLQLRIIHSSSHMFCDETPLPVLQKGRRRTRKCQLCKCQLWAHAVDDRPWQGPAAPAVAYVFATGRGADEIVTQLGTRFTGVMQVDGYAAYKALVKRSKPGRIRLAFLPCPCSPQMRRHAKDHPVAGGVGRGPADCRDLCHQGPYPRPHGGASTNDPPGAEPKADGHAQAAADQLARRHLDAIDPGEKDPPHGSPIGRAFWASAPYNHRS